MGIFAIHYTYPDDTTELATVRPEHRAWLAGQPGLLVAGMYQQGHDEVSAGEPTAEEPSNAALIVYSADSMVEVLTTFDNDPYWLGGHILRRVVREWNPTLGPWVSDTATPRA
ncbi:MAG TPA: YciI family protein [Intrasporangium sp.]|uniref:YciI family protein n=1 Tax=Intrasporangium sp. TaxID=1925024 RepID=UPI002D769F9B|nr:YciI family protein [Intrasporangium sp.]HET7399173.1 YciI family protein [Intrasporangium sp.]